MNGIDEFVQDAERRMDKSVESTQVEFNTVRTGRASAALLDRKGHMQGDMRVLRPGEGPELWLDTEPEAPAAVRRHLGMYKVGRQVELVDAGEERAILSLIGPRAAEIAGSAPLPENDCEAATIGGARCLSVGDNNLG